MTTAAEIEHLQQHGLYSAADEHDADHSEKNVRADVEVVAHGGEIRLENDACICESGRPQHRPER